MGVNRGAKWDIPQIVDPPGERCISIRIPDDDQWEHMLYSAIYGQLAMWLCYRRDAGKNGTKVAQRWREALRTWRDDICPVEPPPGGEEIEEMSNFRIDCNCNVFVKCCDGTEKQILTSDQVKALILGQPGEGAPQPSKGGGQACYPFVMPANNQRIIPTYVNTGDVIAVENAKGLVSNSHTSLWHDAAGNWIAAGLNTGLTEFNGANPVPGAPTSSLIINFGAGWQALGTGSITVPGGVVNVQPIIQVNDNAISNLSGDFQFQVCVTNNQVENWCVKDDFMLSPWGWSPRNADVGFIPSAIYVAGLGWVQTTGVITGIAVSGAEITNTQPMSHVDTVVVDFDYVWGGHTPAGENQFKVQVNGTDYGNVVAPSLSDGHHTITVPIGLSGVDAVTAINVLIDSDQSGSGGSVQINWIEILGSGANKPTGHAC